MKRIFIIFVLALFAFTGESQMASPQNVIYTSNGQDVVSYTRNDTLYVPSKSTISNIRNLEGYDVLTNGHKFFTLEDEIDCSEGYVKFGKISSDIRYTTTSGQLIHVDQAFISNLQEPMIVFVTMNNLSIKTVLDENFTPIKLLPIFLGQ